MSLPTELPCRIEVRVLTWGAFELLLDGRAELFSDLGNACYAAGYHLRREWSPVNPAWLCDPARPN